MNNKELQAARKLLMLDVSEAAEFVGNVSPRTWQYWEVGRYAVPDDVAAEIESLLGMRQDMIDTIREDAGDSEHLTLRYFGSLGEFRDAHDDGTVVGWRLHQSVAAHFYCSGDAGLH